MESSISLLPADINNILRNRRDTTITQRCAQHCATPIIMFSCHDPDTVLHFNGSCEAERQTGISKQSIVHIMNGKGKFARLKTQCGMISAGARVCFKRAVSALEEIRQHAHIVAQVPCDSLQSNSLSTIVFEKPDSQPTFYTKSGHKMTVVQDNGYQRIRVKNFRHVSGKTKNGMIRIHDMIASMFLADWYVNGKTVDHKNRIKHDNRLENLRWAFPSQQNMNQTRGKQQSRRVYTGVDNVYEVWRPLSEASAVQPNADFSGGYFISNYCRVRKGDYLLSVKTTVSGYTSVTINGRLYQNYRLGSMVFEKELWLYLMRQEGISCEKIHVDHRRGKNDPYLCIQECEKYCTDPQLWYKEKVLQVRSSTRKRKRVSA